jgi:hypothetical protein
VPVWTRRPSVETLEGQVADVSFENARLADAIAGGRGIVSKALKHFCTLLGGRQRIGRALRADLQLQVKVAGCIGQMATKEFGKACRGGGGSVLVALRSRSNIGRGEFRAVEQHVVGQEQFDRPFNRRGATVRIQRFAACGQPLQQLLGRTRARCVR